MRPTKVRTDTLAEISHPLGYSRCADSPKSWDSIGPKSQCPMVALGQHKSGEAMCPLLSMCRTPAQRAPTW